jgi:hypothetical protein
LNRNRYHIPENIFLYHMLKVSKVMFGAMKSVEFYRS